jgi:hypothetical protein
MPHEPGMNIQYDQNTKRVVVVFRGVRAELPQRYETAGEAIRAGEEYCRQRGWMGSSSGGGASR